MKFHLILAALAFLPGMVAAQEASGIQNAEAGKAQENPGRGRGRGFGSPIVLGEDDKPAFLAPQDDFDKARDGIAHGKMEMVEYDSKSVGTKRKANVYTPPGYSADKKYPVLKAKKVPHTWHVDEHKHDFQHWKKALYQFSQMIFKPAAE